MILLDEFDIAMIDILRADARLSNREVARRLGVPESRVRLRIKKLEESGVIRFTLLMSARIWNLEFVVFLKLRVKAGQIEEASRLLSESPNVLFLGLTSGDFNLRAVLLSKSLQDVFDFLNGDWTRDHGVTATRVNLAIRSPKHRSDLIRIPD